MWNGEKVAVDWGTVEQARVPTEGWVKTPLRHRPLLFLALKNKGSWTTVKKFSLFAL